MDVTKNRRFRFGLRTLLLIVFLCAVGMQVYMNHCNRIENRALRLVKGMTPEEVHAVMGPPDAPDFGPRNYFRSTTSLIWCQLFTENQREIDDHTDVAVAVYYDEFGRLQQAEVRFFKSERPAFYVVPSNRH